VIPFLHLGPLDIPTFGLMVASAMLAAFFMLREDLIRRGLTAPCDKLPRKPDAKATAKNAAKTSRDSLIPLTQKNVSESQSQPSWHSANAEAEMLIAVPCLAGIVGAKLYHVLETPAVFFAHPLQELFSPYGFAWFGGLLAGFAAFVWVGRRQKIPLLTLLDAGSPAAALGYGIGRIGCLLSGDGDYGIPTSLPWGMSFPDGLVPTTQRVHPTPIYELIVACAIAWWLWRMGARQVAASYLNINRVIATLRTATPEELASLKTNPGKRLSPFEGLMLRKRAQFRCSWRRPPNGTVFATYLVLTGAARFLVEFIRINPRSFLGMSNAQAASLACLIAGVVLRLWLAKKDLNTPA
jgi:phosphatidylglycerol---prolipoprotein diacylglyceryl transferase